MNKNNLSLLLTDDVYTGTLDEFHFQIEQGVPVKNAIDFVIKNSDPFHTCITEIALAECLWHVGEIHPTQIQAARKCLYSDELSAYFYSLGADDAYIRSFQRDAEKMLKGLNATLPAKENWLIRRSIRFQKGDCFWYRSGGRIYSAIVLEKQRSYFLIAVSEKLARSPECPDELLGMPLYTLAWFSDETLLPKNRIHSIGNIKLPVSFTNQYGLLEDKSGAVRLTNYGQAMTWKHTFQMYGANRTLAEIISYQSRLRFSEVNGK